MDIRASIAKFSTLIIAALLITTSNGYGVDCIEYIRSAGAPAYTPIITVLTPEEVKQVESSAKMLSVRPRIRGQGDQRMLTFPGTKEGDIDVAAFSVPLTSKRPDFVQVTGFKEYPEESQLSSIKSKAKGEKPTEPFIHNPAQKFLLYGTLGKQMGVIAKLSAEEQPIALLRISPEARLLITVEEDVSFGFQRSSQKQMSRALIYYIDSSGYSLAAFQIPRGKRFPLVDFIGTKDNKIYLGTVNREVYGFTLNPVKTATAP